MNNNTRINLIGIIAIILISLLYLIVPITPSFVISYIFTVISIIVLIKTFTTFNKGNNGAPQSYVNVKIACSYMVATLIFSVFAYIFLSYNILWTIIIHIVILGVFGIIFLVMGIGNEYISQLDNQEPTEERKKFVEEKKNYWK